MIPTIELPAEPAVQAAAPQPHHRPLRKRVLHNVRRLHMYFGLFLFPWALLYGVTAFLFNHPGAFPDQPRLAFSRSATDGTALERLPAPREQAAAVVAALNQQQQPAVPYQLGAGDVRYVRDFLVATVKTDDRAFTVLYDVKDGTGTIRETPVTATPVKAPFATGPAAAARQRGVGTPETGLKVEGNMVALFRAAVPTLMGRNGFPEGKATVTQAPDLKFPVEADGKTWTATYNPVANTVTGTDQETQGADLSVRRFLLRMHLAHGYPGETNAKWFWAVIVDVMGFVMCFWGLSGLFMWWQIKAARVVGVVILLASAAAATTLAVAMHALLSS